MRRLIVKYHETIVEFIVLISIFLFLLSYFKPELILSKTTTTGGDTASHYYSAVYLKEYLIPNGKIVGWCPGNYAGFPMFQFYFPLTFLLMVLLSYFIPLQISFKIITILGTFLLPITVFLSMRIMKFKFPIPIIAAIFTLIFLFHQGNSMWGGNIPSTLAGEFSYSFSFALSFLFLGSLYNGIRKKQNVVLNSVLISLIALSHVYTLLFIILVSSYFIILELIRKNIKELKEAFLYLFKIYGIAFLLVAFWYIPLVFKLEYTTAYSIKWYIGSNESLFPKVFYPCLILFGISVIAAIKQKEEKIFYLLFALISSTILYFVAPFIDVVDIRFVPFAQFTILLIASYAFTPVVYRVKGNFLLIFIILFFVIFWVNENVSYIPYWIKWNYEGFEGKNSWPLFKEINEFLKGNFSDPRVVYEHNDVHNSFGTVRAFESLPLFSGRATLEGLYMQSSISSPFIFYIQSEISEQQSCPFWNKWKCTVFNMGNGLKHLRMFNVKHIIAISEKAKGALRKNENVKMVKRIGDYEIYEIKNVSGKYVEVLEYEPILVKTKDWKTLSYNWFRNMSEVHLVFVKKISHEDLMYFKIIKTEEELNLNNLPRITVNRNCSIRENIRNEEIEITTTCIRKPHIIKISYFPNWKVEGAKKVYLVSPSFMLIFPEKKNVRIYYDEILIDKLGFYLTILGFVILIYLILFRHFTFNQKIIKFLKR